MLGPSSCYHQGPASQLSSNNYAVSLQQLPLLEDNASHLRMAFILASSTVLLYIMTQITPLLTPIIWQWHEV
jgi:hypothetical protein